MTKPLLIIISLALTLATSCPIGSMEDDVKNKIVTITKGYVQTSAGSLFYRDSRGIGPVVLCIHGNSTGSWLFKKLMRENPDIRFISFDSPGHGKSFRASEQMAEEIYCYSGCGKIFLEALDQAEFEVKEFSILGISKGGHEAINLYALAPDRIKSLILSGTPPIPLIRDSEHAGQIVQAVFKPNPAGNLSSKAENFTEDEAREYLTANGLNPAEHPKKVKMAEQTDGRARALMFKAAHANKRVDEVETLKAATIPVIILGGEDDALINYDYVRKMKWPPHVKIHIVQNEDHSFVWNNPKQFNEILMRYLSNDK